MKIIINQLIRSKRKTLLLQIKTDGSLVVRAPMRYDISRINNFITQKTNWIITKQSAMRKRFLLQQKILKDQAKSREEGILLLGKKQKINFQNLQNKNELILWYKREALKYIEPQLDIFAKNINAKYHKIKITSARKRWGSCSTQGNINFSWRLIMAPKEIVDYVIAHEVAHLLHKNHSSKFWNCVEKMIPDYKNHNLWLRKNGFLLDL